MLYKPPSHSLYISTSVTRIELRQSLVHFGGNINIQTTQLHAILISATLIC